MSILHPNLDTLLVYKETWPCLKTTEIYISIRILHRQTQKIYGTTKARKIRDASTSQLDLIFSTRGVQEVSKGTSGTRRRKRIFYKKMHRGYRYIAMHHQRIFFELWGNFIRRWTGPQFANFYSFHQNPSHKISIRRNMSIFPVLINNNPKSKQYWHNN